MTKRTDKTSSGLEAAVLTASLPGLDRRAFLAAGTAAAALALAPWRARAAALKPEKLVLVVLDNGTYGSTGHQPTASTATDFAAVAQACGMRSDDVSTTDDLRKALDEAKSVDAPVLIRARISLQGQKTPYFLEDPVVLADTFRRYLAGGSA